MGVDNTLQAAIKAVENLSYADWIRLKLSVDLVFDRKKRELEHELKLSESDDLQKIIHEQFG